MSKKELQPLPGECGPITSSGRLPNLKAGDVLRTVTHKDLQALLGPKVRSSPPPLLSLSLRLTGVCIVD